MTGVVLEIRDKPAEPQMQAGGVLATVLQRVLSQYFDLPVQLEQFIQHPGGPGREFRPLLLQ